MKRFSENHAWVVTRDNTACVGLTSYAAEELGDITFVELPEVGTVLTEGDVLCVVESAKAASDIVSPIGGTVETINEKLEANPGLVNTGAENEGWMCEFKEIDSEDLDNLMTEEEYEAFIGGTDAGDEEGTAS